MNKTKTNKYLFTKYVLGFFVISIMLVYFLPFLVLGENSYFIVHDNLDSEFVYKHALVNTGQAFNFSKDATIKQVMDGIPRSAYRSGFDFTLLLFYLFDSHVAYIVNHIVVHMIAFIGMFLLLKKHFIKEDKNTCQVWLLSLCFAFIPFYSQYGISVAGQPLLFYAFLNIIYRKVKIRDFFIIFFFPFYSHIILVAPFILTFLIVLAVVDAFNNKAINKLFVIAILLLGLSYLLVEFQLVFASINNEFVSHRSTWDRWNDLNIASNINRTIEILFETQYHTGKFPTIVILFCTQLALSVLIANKKLNGNLVFVSISILTMCIIVGFHDWLVYLFGNYLSVLKYFNLSRFYFLLPFLFMLLFAISILEISKIKLIAPISWFGIVIQLYLIINSNIEFKNNLKLILGKKIDEPTYSQFFSTKLFSNIDQYIGKPKASYRIVSIGIHPSIAQFNGFYTLDSYQVNYPLSYKLKFRTIIENELNKNEMLKRYFDSWGNRCYIFVDELGKDNMYSKSRNKKISNLNLNTKSLKDLGGEYIFSSVKIINYEENNLNFESYFSDNESHWDIYLYKIQ